MSLDSDMHYYEALFVSASIEHSNSFGMAFDKFSLWREEVIILVSEHFRVRVVCKFEVVETVAV